MRRVGFACALGIAIILIILPSAAGARGRQGHGHGTVVVTSRGSLSGNGMATAPRTDLPPTDHGHQESRFLRNPVAWA